MGWGIGRLKLILFQFTLFCSIWGLYNRYSPHNIKKSCDADLHFSYTKNQQQRYMWTQRRGQNLK